MAFLANVAQKIVVNEVRADTDESAKYVKVRKPKAEMFEMLN